MSILGIIIVILAFAGVFIGVIGTVVPFLPGVPVVLLSALVLAVVGGFSKITFSTLLLLVGLTAVASFLDAIFITRGVKKSGGSWNGMIGATLGCLLGLIVLNIPGAIVGFLVGLTVGEIISGTPLVRIPKFVAGAFWGMLLSSVIQLIIATVMAIIIVIKFFF